MSLVGPGAVRLVLATLVWLHHSTPLRLGGLGVGLFFCLSGYWVMDMWTKRYSRLDRPYLEFVVSRWFRLAPVFFFCTSAAIVAFATGLIDLDISAFASPGWWLSQPFIVGSTHFGRLLPPMWSLDVEMQFYLIAPLIIAWLRNSKLLTAVLVALLLVSWNAVQAAQGKTGETPRVDLWLGVFMVGMIASRFNWRPSKTIALTGLGIGMVLIIGIILTPALHGMVILRGRDGSPPSGWLPTIAFLATVGTAIPFVLWSVRVPSSKFDRMLGDWSYPLYLIHWLPRNWYYSQLHAGTGVWLPLLVNFVISYAAALAILICVDRPFQRLRSRWIKSHERRNDQPSVAAVVGAAPMETT